ncbi:hypothetical protein J2Z65_005174 [Paenibacillus aceris]|uniref:Uncharacterized protein n=1 Tax=Paenibacillus aceris TaxID=869555 RepID=A0ABS4I4S9_9BACL|nr:hypothetical protein [Paenibacillus aceris]
MRTAGTRFPGWNWSILRSKIKELMKDLAAMARFFF